jgi:hypothetical protein
VARKTFAPGDDIEFTLTAARRDHEQTWKPGAYIELGPDKWHRVRNAVGTFAVPAARIRAARAIAAPSTCTRCLGPIDDDGECRCITEECKTCGGAGIIRDGETKCLRRCLDCGGRGERAKETK